MSTTPTKSQVQSGSFRVMLKVLLDDETPALSIKDAYKYNKELLFLDAREAKEFQVSHINGAIWVGSKKFSLASIAGIPKQKPLLVYCSVGKRSEMIVKILQQAGYSHVYNLYGGVFEWINQGYPIVNMHQQTTVKVHAYNRFWGQWLTKGEKVYD